MKKKKRTSLLSRRQFVNMIESYAAIVSLPDVDIKEYAKAAIRDIFIQMPSRSVNLNNWSGYKNYISGFFGENSYETAMKELQNEGWLTKGETRYEWVKAYGPVGTVPKLVYLNEWADGINKVKLPNSNKVKRVHLSYNNKDSYPFGNVHGKLQLGRPGTTHGFAGMRDGKIYGRLWAKHKILSFWKYPTSKNELKDYISELNLKLKSVDIQIDNSWYIDVPYINVDLKSKNFDYEIDKLTSKLDMSVDDLYDDIISILVPINTWTPEITFSQKQYFKKIEKAMQKQMQKHLASPISKRTLVPAGWGSKKLAANLPAAQRHQTSSTSESITEWADSIKTDKFDIDYKEEGTYPFAYNIKNYDASFGKHMMTHATIQGNKLGEKRNNILLGRVWTHEKILSLWEYPDTKAMYKAMITKINEEMQKLNIGKIDSSWKFEIPNAAINFMSTHMFNLMQLARDSEGEQYVRNVKSFLIPVFDWSPDIMKNPKKYKKELEIKKNQHLMSPVVKTADVVSGVGSKKTPAGLSSTQQHQMKSTSENKLNEMKTEYGCLMLKLHIPWWKDFVEVYIRDEDIYNNSAQEYGREYEYHITILYGFKYSLPSDVEKIKKILYTLKNPISARLTEISIFKTNKFDVVKFDVESKMIQKLNEIMTFNFDYVRLHSKYTPHVTIAYVNSGAGDKYVKELKNAIHVTSAEFIYSYPGGKQETFNILKSDLKMI